MKNREQIRARNALSADAAFKGKKEGDPLSGFPALLLNNGLLATIAFSKKQKGGHLEICDAIAHHLADKEIALLPDRGANTDSMLKYLCGEESDKLRLCTSEALAFLHYLRRFAKAREK